MRLNFSFFLNQISRFAVPLFFLISGFTLEYRYFEKINIKYYFKKRVSRLLVPYILWSSIYYVVFYKHHTISLFSSNFLNQVIVGSASIQMYFIPSIILLYIIFPILHKYVYYLFKKWLFILLTLVQVLLLFVDYYNGGIGLTTPLRITLLSFYLFFLGIIAVHKQEQIQIYLKKYYIFIIVLLIASASTMLYESKVNYFNSLNINFITSQWRLSTYLYTITLAGLFFTFFQKKFTRFYSLLQSFSRLTFFVFFVHVFFISLFWRLIGSYLFSNSTGHILENALFDPLVFLFVTSLSFLLAYSISFVPKLRWILGII